MDVAELIPIAEAAGRLGVGKQTLYNYRNRGTGPESQIIMEGNYRRIYYHPDVINAWIAKRESRARQAEKNRRRKAAARANKAAPVQQMAA